MLLHRFRAGYRATALLPTIPGDTQGRPVRHDQETIWFPLPLIFGSHNHTEKA